MLSRAVGVVTVVRPFLGEYREQQTGKEEKEASTMYLLSSHHSRPTSVAYSFLRQRAKTPVNIANGATEPVSQKRCDNPPHHASGDRETPTATFPRPRPPLFGARATGPPLISSTSPGRPRQNPTVIERSHYAFQQERSTLCEALYLDNVVDDGIVRFLLFFPGRGPENNASPTYEHRYSLGG